MIWDSPPISNNFTDFGQNPVEYTIWIDGKSTIKYLSSVDQIKNFFSGTAVGSCAYSKLQIHDGSILSNPSSSYYYNTNSGLQTILQYIEDNTSFSRPTEFDKYQSISLETIVSRIYIQAHRTDPETGDTHYGAVSYVDLSNGIPTVYEGETIDDISPSDPDDGVKTDTSQPYTVSGDNIIYDNSQTYNYNTNNYGGDGLVIVGGGSLLAAGLNLITAVLELIKSFFLLNLVPFITMGFTGHF